jgi:hypothetical protein
LVNTHCVSINATGDLVDNGSACGTSSGGVTSVGLTMPAVFTVANSPLVAAGTLVVSANGTSGGIPYFASATTFASSAALTANLPVIGGGPGAAPTVGTRSGNTTQFVTTTGTQTSGNCVKIDVNGNHIDGGPCAAGGAPGGATNTVQYNAGGGVFGGTANVTSNGTNLTAARLSSSGILSWDNGAGAAGSSISVVTNGVLQIGNGAANNSGYYQWAGQARNTSDYSVSNSTTMIDVPGLSVNLVSGRTYRFEFDGLCNGISAGGGGAQVGLGGTATQGANTRYYAYAVTPNAIVGGAPNAALVITPQSTNNALCSIRGAIAAGSTGTLTIQFAQQAINASASILRANSMLYVWDTP